LNAHDIASEAKELVYKKAIRRGHSDEQASKITPVLLCWESPEQFCHRHLVSKWMEYETGMYVPEVKIPVGTQDLAVIKRAQTKGYIKETNPIDHEQLMLI
jgi:hypothetical protein